MSYRRLPRRLRHVKAHKGRGFHDLISFRRPPYDRKIVFVISCLQLWGGLKIIFIVTNFFSLGTTDCGYPFHPGPRDQTACCIPGPG